MSKKYIDFPFDVPALVKRSREYKSPPAKQTTEKPVKLRLDKYTYVTKSNGKLVTVRDNRPPTIYSAGWNLLQEYLDERSQRKMDQKSKQAKVPGAENKPASAAIQITPFDPNANLRPPGMPQAMMAPVGPNGPVSGLYRHGDRQLALLPLASPLSFQGIPPGASPRSPQVMPHQPMFAYPPPMIYPPAPVMAGYNFPPMGYDPRQFLPAAQPTNTSATQTSVTITKHVCAKCGKVRSNKFHHYNPLKPGEVPAAAFCGKCEKDLTSTDVSDNEEGGITEQEKKSKNRDYKSKERGEGAVSLSQDSAESKTSIKSISTKETRSTQTEEDVIISREELHINKSKSSNGSSPRTNRRHRRHRHRGERNDHNSQAKPSPLFPHSPLTHSASKHSSSRNLSSSRNSSPEQSLLNDNHLAQPSPREKKSRDIGPKHSLQNQPVNRDDMREHTRYRAQEQLFSNRPAGRFGVESILTNRPEEFYRKQDTPSQPTIVTKERKKLRKASKFDAQDLVRPQAEHRNDYLVTRSNASTTTISSGEASRQREADLIAKDLGLQNGSHFRIVRHRGSPPSQCHRPFQEEAERASDAEIIVGKISQRLTPEPTASKVVCDKKDGRGVPLIIISDEEKKNHRQERGETTVFGLDKTTGRFATESAAPEHYREDWSRIAQSDPSSYTIRPRNSNQGWHSGPSRRYQPSISSDSMINLDDAIPPPAPTPPTASELGIEDYPPWAKFSNMRKGPYPFDPKDDSQQASTIAMVSSNNRNHKAETAQRKGPASHYRPPYVRDVTDRGSEKVSSMSLVRRATNEITERNFAPFQDHPPRRHSRDQSPGRTREQAVFSEDDSDITENIERVERRVTFQDIIDHGRRSSSAHRRRPSWASRVDTML